MIVVLVMDVVTSIESQSIDINSIKINNYVPNDCESLPIDIDEIAIGGRESEREKVGGRDGEI